MYLKGSDRQENNFSSVGLPPNVANSKAKVRNPDLPQVAGTQIPGPFSAAFPGIYQGARLKQSTLYLNEYPYTVEKNVF